jgi:rubrerythrin
MTHDQQSLSLAILCLVMVLQIALMARWQRAMQRTNKAATDQVSHVLTCWRDHSETHRELVRELACRAEQLSRLEVTMVAIVEQVPIPGTSEEWQDANMTMLGLDPNSEARNSKIATGPDGLPIVRTRMPVPVLKPEFVCVACGAEIFFQQVPGPCPQCGAARPS